MVFHLLATYHSNFLHLLVQRTFCHHVVHSMFRSAFASTINLPIPFSLQFNSLKFMIIIACVSLITLNRITTCSSSYEYFFEYLWSTCLFLFDTNLDYELRGFGHRSFLFSVIHHVTERYEQRPLIDQSSIYCTGVQWGATKMTDQNNHNRNIS